MSQARIDKTERLLNLTLALLATKRPMTKGEIFEKIPGYTGTPDSMERMFERDKDELRELGIVVEVLPTDAYFDDEFGYRIISREFFLQKITFTSEESVWLTLAANVITDSTERNQARAGLQKLLSASSAPMEGILEFDNPHHLRITLDRTLNQLWKAMRDKRAISFPYSSARSQDIRVVSPYLLTSRWGHWYVVAQDHKDRQVKTFRIDRMGALTFDGHWEFLEQPQTFSIEDFLERFRGEQVAKTSIKVHRSLAPEHPLVLRSTATESAHPIEPGSLITILNQDRSEIVEMILWAADAVEVIEPQELREEIASILERIIEEGE